jgi:hypothetical protein
VSLLPHRKIKRIEIITYGMETASLEEQRQLEILDWIASTMAVSNYKSLAHLIFNDDCDNFIGLGPLIGYFREQPVLLYRCGARTPSLPYGCYWRLMGEHPSLRIYQMDQMDQLSS